jgi:hypothetical protein
VPAQFAGLDGASASGTVKKYTEFREPALWAGTQRVWRIVGEEIFCIEHTARFIGLLRLAVRYFSKKIYFVLNIEQNFFDVDGDEGPVGREALGLLATNVDVVLSRRSCHSNAVSCSIVFETNIFPTLIFF